MTPERIRQLLRSVKDGDLDIDEAMSRLERLPFEDLGFARVDHHRTMRQGFPEVVFCQGKTVDQTVEISRRIVDAGSPLLATRADEATAEALVAAFDRAEHNRLARTIRVPCGEETAPHLSGTILIVSAGTSDLPVAEEAAVTAEAMGNRVERLHDVGVAGLHRLLAHTDMIHEASVIVVAAGMEGALASVVGGLVDVPVVAVPTSVGYGASFGGLAALLAMLNSCAPGVTVVNIDNGFGAGVAASQINRLYENGEGREEGGEP
ncbi:MAG: nickel pincer cofactor biosynthesis protein LarB [Candidatus Latescibacteria bacterium]|nr:nickel pincer cofactor biosynthesis protein LarB [Candidatus Latescibacterota bacterium]